MRKVHTHTTLTQKDDSSWVVLHDNFYWYAGSFAESKKGRKEQEQITKANLDQMLAEQVRRRGQQALLDPLISSYTSLGGNTMSPNATAQMAAERDQIANTYAGLRRTAIRSMGASSPDRSGLAATRINALEQGRAEADTGAFRHGQAETSRQRELGMGLLQGEEQGAGQQSLGAGNLSSESALRRSQMGSTFGDIMGGIGQVAGIATDILVPGSGLLRNLGKKAIGGAASGIAHYGGAGRG